MWGVTEAIEPTSIGPAGKSVIAPDTRSTRQMLRLSEARQTMLRLSSPDSSRSVEDGDEDASIVRTVGGNGVRDHDGAIAPSPHGLEGLSTWALVDELDVDDD